MVGRLDMRSTALFEFALALGFGTAMAATGRLMGVMTLSSWVQEVLLMARQDLRYLIWTQAYILRSGLVL